FTGSPNDLRPVAAGLHDAGVAVEAIRLPGHCQGPDALNASDRKQWAGAVRQSARRLRERFERVAVCGLSMGGLLALELAIDQPDTVDVLISLATPARFPPLFHVGLGAYQLLGRPGFMAKITKPPRKPGQDERFLDYDPSGNVYPMDASLELERLRNHVVDQLGQVTQPLLVLHGKADPTTPWQSALDIIGAVSSETNRLVLL